MTVGADGLDFSDGRTLRVVPSSDGMLDVSYTRGVMPNARYCGHGIILLSPELGHRLEAMANSHGPDTARVSILVFEDGRSIHAILDRVLTSFGV